MLVCLHAVYYSDYHNQRTLCECTVHMYTHTVCTDHERGKLRLMNGTNRYEGRVEICQRFNHYQYVWWSLCSDEWDAREAAVVCKQLGYLENYAQNGKSWNVIKSITVCMHAWSFEQN